jgi:hypothetical protein
MKCETQFHMLSFVMSIHSFFVLVFSWLLLKVESNQQPVLIMTLSSLLSFLKLHIPPIFSNKEILNYYYTILYYLVQLVKQNTHTYPFWVQFHSSSSLFPLPKFQFQLSITYIHYPHSCLHKSTISSS